MGLQGYLVIFASFKCQISTKLPYEYTKKHKALQNGHTEILVLNLKYIMFKNSITHSTKPNPHTTNF